VYKWCVYSYYERRIWRSGIGEIYCVRTSRSVGSQLGQARGSIPERRGVRSEELRGEKENEMLIILEIDNGRGEHNRAEQRRTEENRGEERGVTWKDCIRAISLCWWPNSCSW
jgi:hypothetical protein